MCLKGGHVFFPADGDLALKTWWADPIFLFIICRRLLERATHSSRYDVSPDAAYYFSKQGLSG